MGISVIAGRALRFNKATTIFEREPRAASQKARPVLSANGMVRPRAPAPPTIRYAVVIGAFYPDMMRETIRDQMAEAGITEEDLRELIQKLEGVPGTKH
jgi:hypothetical protein